MGNQRLTLVTQPQDYFRELITASLGRQKVSARPETEFYLVNLLNQFMTSERLPEEPLAMMLKEALEQPAPAQAPLFRQIGDVSLYVGGFFQDSLARKLVHVDYYIEMGSASYQQVLARSSSEDALREVYAELASKFASFIDVFADVSDKTTPRTEKDLLRMYELWVRTRSERAAKALQEAGILPNETVKKDWQ